MQIGDQRVIPPFKNSGGNFSAMAACLRRLQNEHLTRAAVSMQMKQFEADLGVEIFDRRGRIPELNARGKAIVPKAIEIIESYEQLRREARDESKISGELNIGAMFTAMTGVVPHAIKQLRATLTLTCIFRRRPDIRQILSRRLIADQSMRPLSDDLLFWGSQLIFHPITEEPFHLLQPLDSPLTDVREILEAYPFIRISRSLWSGQLIDDWLVRENINVDEVMELDGIQMISTMVFHGLGVSVVPKRCVPAPNPVPVSEVAIDSMAAREVGLLVRYDNPKSNLIDALCKQLKRVVEGVATSQTKHSEGSVSGIG